MENTIIEHQKERKPKSRFDQPVENTIIEHQQERKPKSRFYNIIFNGVIFLVMTSKAEVIESIILLLLLLFFLFFFLFFFRKKGKKFQGGSWSLSKNLIVITDTV